MTDIYVINPLKDLWRWSKPLLKSTSFKSLGSSDDEVVFKSGLICLKGGDLAKEISESDLKPKSVEITTLFQEDFFEEKYLLYATG